MLDVYLYGSGECDQLGPFEDTYESKVPLRVVGFNTVPSNKVYQICCGGQFTLVLTTSGHVYSWGNNDEMSLGRDGNPLEVQLIDKISFPISNIAAGLLHAVAYNTELNLLYIWGKYRTENNDTVGDISDYPKLMDMKLFKNKKLKKVVCGNNHTIVLADDSVFAWGNSESGQTGINPRSKKKKDELTPSLLVKQSVVDVFTGSNHSFLIQEKQGRKVIKGWGLNKNGQLGVGNKENFWYPFEIEYFTENNIRIKSASAGDHHSLFLSEDSQLYACGRNVEGQCGIILDSQPVITQTQGPTNQTVAISEVVETIQDNRENVENSNPQPVTEKTDSKDNNSDYDVPVKIEFFNNSNIKINNIYSCTGYNYALDSNDNQAYSWGDSYCYILGNKKTMGCLRTPFAIPKNFFFNLKVDHFSLSTQHVSVALSDPSSNLPRPELEYDVIPYLEQLRLKVEEKKTKPGKRKREISAAEEMEIGAIGEKRKRYEVTVSDRVLRSATRKPSVSAPKQPEKTVSKSKEKKPRGKSVKKNDKKSKSKDKKSQAKTKGNNSSTSVSKKINNKKVSKK